MHKDVIFLEQNLRTHEVLSWDDSISILDQLNQSHFCTLYWVTSDSHKANRYSSEHHDQYKFAISVISQSEFQFHKTLNLCDTEDILIVYDKINCDLQKAFEAQKDHMMDCTILGEKIETASGFILYRKGFQSLPIDEPFDFIKDYIMKADTHQHNLQYFK